MGLRFSLIIRIILVALTCLIVSAVYVMYDTDRHAKQRAANTAERINKEISLQFQQIYKGYAHAEGFPNTELWHGINGLPGSCIQFESRNNKQKRHVCNQNNNENPSWPVWFGKVYEHFFDPGYEVEYRISFFALYIGTVIVTLNKDIELSMAWRSLKGLMGLTVTTVFAVSLLVFLAISRILQPAKSIVDGLEHMARGNLDTRLKNYDIKEWKKTADAINQLAESQQKIIASNKQLAFKLINVQEEEHRHISRELHDEFGQCLAAINAVTSSIKQTAEHKCPELLTETDTISRTTLHMMDALRDLLTRLRPIDIDELGLINSLEKLINSWNNHTNDSTHYHLHIDGNINRLPKPLPVNVYRIIQESLTNISKHANASKAEVFINKVSNNIHIRIQDDGIVATTKDFNFSSGVGLLGIKERVAALGGDIMFANAQPTGLLISINLPIQTDYE